MVSERAWRPHRATLPTARARSPVPNPATAWSRTNQGKPAFGKAPGEAETLERIKLLEASGINCQEIADRLNAEERKTRYGGPWRANRVHVILRRLGVRKPQPNWSRKLYGARPGESETLARIRAMRQSGMSWNGIASLLNAEGTKPRQGKQWWNTTVWKVLRD